MVARDVAERVIEDYLDAVSRRLVGPRTARAAILDELRDGLHEAAAAHARHGDGDEVSARAAVRGFGSPAAIAGAFAGELACVQARRTVAGYLATGPVVGLLWLLVLTPPSRMTLRDAAVPWSVVPPLPLIALAVVTGGVVLAATGRPSRWVLVPARHVVDGAIVVVAAAVLGDLLLLALATRSVAPGSMSTGALAITASLIRLGVGVPVAARGLRARRAVPAVRRP